MTLANWDPLLNPNTIGLIAMLGLRILDKPHSLGIVERYSNNLNRDLFSFFLYYFVEIVCVSVYGLFIINVVVVI